MEASWLLRPVLRHSEGIRRIEHLISTRLRAFSASVDSIVRGTNVRVPRGALFELLEDLAMEIDSPALGLQTIGERPLETLLDYLFVTSATVGDALGALAAAKRLSNDVPVELEMQKRVVLRHHVDTDQAQQYVEGVTATVVRHIRANVGPDWAPLEVRLPHRRPPRTTALEDVLRCPIYFAAPLEIHFAREDCALPLRRSDAVLHALLVRLATEQLASIPKLSEQATHSTRTVLREALPQRNASLEAVADRLKLGARTLQRRLREEGTDYLTLLDDTRRELATQLLADGTRKLLDVAYELGFSDASSLHRAVRRWTGKPPSEFRKGRGGPKS